MSTTILPSDCETSPRPGQAQSPRWRRLRGVVNARLFGDESPKVGRYRLLQSLGSGAMGVVFSALDTELQRNVAIKLLTGEPDDDQRRRLQREAQAMARVVHPNVVGVYDVGESDGELYVAMELVTGVTLRAWLEAGASTRPWREIVTVFVAAARGLAAAHAAGLVHRDFKPENVLVADDGRVCVVDFGLVMRGQGASDPLVDDGTPLPTAIDASIPMAGTPAYMAPEQVQGRPVDARADVWSFCVALFEALYGRRPFDRDGVSATLAAVLVGDIRWPPRSSVVPAGLARMLRRGLRVDRDDRNLDMATIVRELGGLLAARRRRLLAVGTLVASVSFAAVAVRAFAGPAPVCQDANAALGAAWDDTRREQVLAGVATHGLGSTAEIAAALDEHARRWRVQFEATCEPGLPNREVLARQLCLEGQRAEFDASTQVLAQADLAMARNVPQVVTALVDPALCAEPGSRPPSYEETASPEVTAWRLGLARARALWNAGEDRRAKESARVVFEAAHDAQAWAVAADAGVLYGEVAFVAMEDLRDEVPILEQARADAGRAAYPVAAARLSAVLNYDPDYHGGSDLRGRFAVALGHAESVDDPEARAILALALLQVGGAAFGIEAERADAMHLSALELATARLGGGHRITRALGQPLRGPRRASPTVDAALASLQQLEVDWGPNSGEAAKAHLVLATAYRDQGRWEEAIAAQRIGVDLLRTIDGASGTGHTRALAGLMRMVFVAGDLETGVALGEEALAAMRDVPPDPRLYGHTQQDIARDVALALVAAGEIDRALGFARLAADWNENVQRIYGAMLLAELLVRTGDLAGAQRETDVAWAVMHDPTLEMPSSITIARIGLVRAMLHFARGEHGQAEQELHRATPDLFTTMQREHVLAYEGLARAALERGDLDDAKLHLGRALQFVGGGSNASVDSGELDNRTDPRDPAVVDLRATEAAIARAAASGR